MRGYEVTPARTGTSLPIWKYQLCGVSAVTVGVYSESFCSPEKSPPGSVSFKLAHLLPEVRSNKVQVLYYCAFGGLSHVLSLGTLLKYFSLSNNFFTFTQISGLHWRLLSLEKNMLTFIITFIIELKLFDL